MNNFKSNLKEISSQLKGLTLQLITNSGVKPYNTLKEFGHAVLAEEKAGNSLILKKAWTVSGLVEVKSFAQLSEMIAKGIVTGVQFMSSYSPVTFSDYLRNEFGTND